MSKNEKYPSKSSRKKHEKGEDSSERMKEYGKKGRKKK